MHKLKQNPNMHLEGGILFESLRQDLDICTSSQYETESLNSLVEAQTYSGWE